jgi:indole-3-glycerol phosphate synthase
VLTDGPFFGGSVDDLRGRPWSGVPCCGRISSSTSSSRRGQQQASAVLLSSGARGRQLRALAPRRVGLEALVEVHTEREIDRA